MKHLKKDAQHWQRNHLKKCWNYYMRSHLSFVCFNGILLMFTTPASGLCIEFITFWITNSFIRRNNDGWLGLVWRICLNQEAVTRPALYLYHILDFDWPCVSWVRLITICGVTLSLRKLLAIDNNSRKSFSKYVGLYRLLVVLLVGGPLNKQTPYWMHGSVTESTIDLHLSLESSWKIFVFDLQMVV